jgi:hypothetical protein
MWGNISVQRLLRKLFVTNSPLDINFYIFIFALEFVYLFCTALITPGLVSIFITDTPFLKTINEFPAQLIFVSVYCVKQFMEYIYTKIRLVGLHSGICSFSKIAHTSTVTIMSKKDYCVL